MNVNFKITETKHLLIKACINGVQGNFILDTGASNSCVGFEGVELFQLNAVTSKTKASGAGTTGMFTQLAKNNLLEIGSWKKEDFPIIIIDMTHVNQALEQYKVNSVDGIIGADVLIMSKAIIDYSNCYIILNQV